MNLKCGIVGLPNVGKSTLFNCFSNAKAQAANYPFCTIEANLGVIMVPDERLYKIAEIIKPYKVTPATIEIIDIAGLVKGASKGEGLGNKFLSNIRECSAIIHVLRCFDNDNITHIEGSINPLRDKEIVDMELQLKDLETIDKRILKTEKQAKNGDKSAIKLYDLLKNIKKHLEQGKPARTFNFNEKEYDIIKELHLLTMKPVLYVCNVDENSVVSGNKYVKMVKELIKEEGSELLLISAAIEEEIAKLDNYDEKNIFLEELGLKEPGVNKLIISAYKLLNLQTFFTAGKKETRAWTIKKGITALQAAGTIHTDFQKGFIKAEVIKYEDFLKYKSEQVCREMGKISLEGKEYIVQDGDIIHFKFNI